MKGKNTPAGFAIPFPPGIRLCKKNVSGLSHPG